MLNFGINLIAQYISVIFPCLFNNSVVLSPGGCGGAGPRSAPFWLVTYFLRAALLLRVQSEQVVVDEPLICQSHLLEALLFVVSVYASTECPVDVWSSRSLGRFLCRL